MRMGLSRASWYYEPVEESQENLGLMRLIGSAASC